MAKKKQFAGKKTKLARLPLTQALANQAEAEAPWSPPSTPPLSAPAQFPLTWDEVDAGHGEPLAAAFLALVRELAELQGELPSGSGPPAVNYQTFLPDRVPQPPRIMHALQQARLGLLDLKSLLSQR